MMEGDFVPLDKTAQVIMIRDHARNIHVQLAVTPAMQKVVKAMILFANQYDETFFLS